jgi:two-component system sensor histidine kinase UhpB
VSLYWRVLLLNAAVLVSATALLLFAPVTVSVPVLPREAWVLVGGLAVSLVANALLLRLGFAPLRHLAHLMARIDLLRPSQRLPIRGGGSIAGLIRSFNEMLDRLEAERSDSAARALSAQEAERQRIAQELHDEIGQSLTALLLELKRAGDHAPEPLRTELRQAQEITRDSLDEVRRIARRLRPGVLEDLGLVSALIDLTTEFSIHTGLAIQRRFEPRLPKLGPDAELVLYRVAQESLTNTARHAAAARVEVALARDPGGVGLSVRDDGHGLGHSPEGAGIHGMRERAMLVGAQLTIETRREGGTEVRLLVPIPESQDRNSDHERIDQDPDTAR